MATYYVVSPPASTDPEKDTLFIRDAFSWLAFLFPLPWLLVKRLWLVAGLVVAVYAAAILLAEYVGLDGLPFAMSFVISLWLGFEGGHIRAAWLIRKGWREEAIVSAHDLDEAEEIYFSGLARPSDTLATPLIPARAPAAAGANSVALGLIGPFGGR